MSARLPDLVIIGAPKAGTTTLASWLSKHPQVAFSAQKELEFFDRRYDQGLEWYLSRLPADPGDRLVAEATPTYLGTPEAPARVAAVLPKARFAAILREPVSRAWSNYWFFCMLGVERRAWSHAVRDELAGKRGSGYLDLGRYADQIAHWDAAVGPERLHLALMDDLRTNPDALYAGLCRFAGIDVVAPPSQGSVNPTSRPRSTTAQYLLRSTDAGRLRRRLFLWNAKGGPVPKMDPAERASLVATFADDNARLAERLGRPLPPSWS